MTEKTELEKSMVVLEGIIKMSETARKIVDGHLTERPLAVSWHTLILKDNIKNLVEIFELRDEIKTPQTLA